MEHKEIQYDIVEEKEDDESLMEIKELNEIIDELEEEIEILRVSNDEKDNTIDSIVTELHELSDEYDDIVVNADKMFDFINEHIDTDKIKEFHKTLSENYLLIQMNNGKKVYY